MGVGTLFYLPIEGLDPNIAKQAKIEDLVYLRDIWGLGIVFYELIYKKYPWDYEKV